MKLLTTEQQVQLQELVQSIHDHFPDAYPTIVKADLAFWAIELKPKRGRKKKGGLDLNTEEGVIEQAYQEHTGNI